MTKQEKIREGMGNIIGDQGYYFPWEECTQEILSYLHSQGVVIKVDRELSDSLMEGQESFDRQTYKVMLEHEGYVAVEPLI